MPTIPRGPTPIPTEGAATRGPRTLSSRHRSLPGSVP